MGRYLAIFTGAATSEAQSAILEEESRAFVAAWGAWASGLGEALVDPGAPLFRKVRLTGRGAVAFSDAKTGYAILEAGSHEDAVAMFATHPHLGLAEGNSIEIIECPAPPG